MEGEAGPCLFLSGLSHFVLLFKLWFTGNSSPPFYPVVSLRIDEVWGYMLKHGQPVSGRLAREVQGPPPSFDQSPAKGSFLVLHRGLGWPGCPWDERLCDACCPLRLVAGLQSRLESSGGPSSKP